MKIDFVLILITISLTIGTLAFAFEESKKSEASKEKIAPDWEQSYRAGYIERRGHYAGGSEILHLVGHQGKIYAAAGYWMDNRNIWYGGIEPNTGWAQILRLDQPGGPWEVDLEMGPFHLRPEILKSITFHTDERGKTLPEPVNLLFAAAFSVQEGGTEIHWFIRDDKTGQWEKNRVIPRFTGESGENNSVRCVKVYRDKVTGIERIFITLGVLGIYSGVYDPEAPGKIRWEDQSESGRVKIRPLAIIEANGALLFSAGSSIYRRNDGQSPTYTVVHDVSDLFPGKVASPVGGIRGLTAIPNPKGPGDSLLFVLGESGRSRGCIYRLDPDGNGGYSRTQETCLNNLMTEYLNGNPVYYILAGYNDMLPVVDPLTQEAVHLIGFEAFIGGQKFPITQRGENGGYYTGALYAIRDKKGQYRMKEVNVPVTVSKPELVAPRAYVLSPFAGDQQKVIYFGGYDCNFVKSANTAWVFKTSLENALRRETQKP